MSLLKYSLVCPSVSWPYVKRSNIHPVARDTFLESSKNLKLLDGETFIIYFFNIFLLCSG